MLIFGLVRVGGFACFRVQVLLLKRQSVRRTRYDWFERYCGLPEDSTRLFNAVLDNLRYDAFLDLVKDEFAPVGIIVDVSVRVTLCVRSSTYILTNRCVCIHVCVCVCMCVCM